MYVQCGDRAWLSWQSELWHDSIPIVHYLFMRDMTPSYMSSFFLFALLPSFIWAVRRLGMIFMTIWVSSIGGTCARKWWWSSAEIARYFDSSHDTRHTHEWDTTHKNGTWHIRMSRVHLYLYSSYDTRMGHAPHIWMLHDTWEWVTTFGIPMQVMTHGTHMNHTWHIRMRHDT